jgi:hypothetical protein
MTSVTREALTDSARDFLLPSTSPDMASGEWWCLSS